MHALRCLLLQPVILCMVLAVRSPPPPAFDLAGACAGVKLSETWKDADGVFHWSYKIKVQPWTTFGRVSVTLHGWGMQLEKTYYGSVASPAKSFDVLLHPQAGPDNIFEIQGTGEVYADPELQCAGLQVLPVAYLRDACVTVIPAS